MKACWKCGSVDVNWSEPERMIICSGCGNCGNWGDKEESIIWWDTRWIEDHLRESLEESYREANTRLEIRTEIIDSKSRRIRQLEALLQDAYNDGSHWKSELDMYMHAWARELGGLIPKTHLIDSLVLTTRGRMQELRQAQNALKEYREILGDHS